MVDKPEEQVEYDKVKIDNVESESVDKVDDIRQKEEESEEDFGYRRTSSEQVHLIQGLKANLLIDPNVSLSIDGLDDEFIKDSPLEPLGQQDPLQLSTLISPSSVEFHSPDKVNKSKRLLSHSKLCPKKP